MEKCGRANTRILVLMQNAIQLGHTVMIVTNRCSEEFLEIEHFLQEHSLDVPIISSRGHWPKGPLLKSLGIDIHFDDNHEHVVSSIAEGVFCIHVDRQIYGPYGPSSLFPGL